LEGKTRILVADDEERMRSLVRMYLEKEGFAVEEAADGGEALAQLDAGEYDLLILDLMMPDTDGWSVCRKVRQTRDVPIIMLTARGEEFDRVLGFEVGADDYVVKPFSPRELMARVKALLRRSRGTVSGEGDGLKYPGLTIEFASRRVTAGEETLVLTPKEYDLLVFLAGHPGKVFTREQILNQVWGYDFFGDTRTVDTHIKKLREKLTRPGGVPEFIRTVWGVGYQFEVKNR